MNELLTATEASISGGWIAGGTIAFLTIIGVVLSKLIEIVRGLSAFRDEWDKFHKPKQHDYKPQLRMDADITQHLRTIKHDLGADRVLVIQLKNGDYSLARIPFMKYTATHEQLRSNVSSVMLHMEQVQASMFAALNVRILDGENVCIPDLDAAVEKDPTLNTLGQFLSAHNTKAVYFFPLAKSDGTVYGMGMVEYLDTHTIDEKWVDWTHDRFIQIGAMLEKVAYSDDEVAK